MLFQIKQPHISLFASVFVLKIKERMKSLEKIAKLSPHKLCKSWFQRQAARPRSDTPGELHRLSHRPLTSKVETVNCFARFPLEQQML